CGILEGDFANVVFTLTFIASAISVFAAITYVVVFLRFQTKNTQNILIALLTTANGLTCFETLLGTFHYKTDIPFGRGEGFCVFQSIICTYFGIVADIYTFYVELCICLRIAFGLTIIRTRTAKVVYHVLAWVVPLIIVLCAWGRGTLGESETIAGMWCWISDGVSKQERWVWMVVTKQGWELVVYLSTCFMFIIIIYQRYCRKVHPSITNSYNESRRLFDSGNSTDNAERQQSSVNSILVWVGIYFYLAKMWGTIRYSVHIYSLAFDADISGFRPVEKYFFVLFQSVADSLQATITFCIFVLKDKDMRHKLFCKCKEKEEQGSSEKDITP
ncbi:uncharacterized protein, partial [Argopecten irradians]|uniref:uncharacterized protein n=1 Tax=Argopecten irradians TaxID=31199 RepID=UPI003712C4D9